MAPAILASPAIVTFEERPPDIVNNVASLGFGLDDLIARNKIHIEHVAVDPPNSPKSATMILKPCSFGWSWPFNRWGRSGSCSTPSRACSPHFQTPQSCEPKSAACSTGSRSVSSPRSSPRSGARERSPARAWRSTSPIVFFCWIIGPEPDIHPPAPHREVSRHRSWHQRISISDRRRRLQRASGERARSRHKVFEERISTGIPDLDAMLAGGGFHRGSSILVSGVAGSGKSSLAASFVDAACRNGENALYFSLRNPPSRWCETCIRSESTSSPTWTRANSTMSRRGRRSTASNAPRDHVARNCAVKAETRRPRPDLRLRFVGTRGRNPGHAAQNGRFSKSRGVTGVLPI